MNHSYSNNKHIGFVSSRLSGTDSVSIESAKWDDVLSRMGFSNYYFAGEIDRDPKKSYHFEKAHYRYPDIREITTDCFHISSIGKKIPSIVDEYKELYKIHLYRFIESFKIDLLVIEDVLSYPLNLPLGMAIIDLIDETQLPAVGHHHNFYWENPFFNFEPILDNIYNKNVTKIDRKHTELSQKVFLSYAKEDLDAAKIIYQRLKKHGVDVWVDFMELLPGQKWKTTIQENIKKCSAIIVLLSSRSIGKRGYVQAEIKTAIEVYHDEIPHNEIFIVPIRIEECTPSNPELCEIQWIDFFEIKTDNLEKLLKVLPKTNIKPKTKQTVANILMDFFNPDRKNLKHIVTNSIALEELYYRTNIVAEVIPLVMNFENPTYGLDGYAEDVRSSLGLRNFELLFLQPTRVLKSKGIEHAIEFVKRIGAKGKLVISHASGDEGYSYERRVWEYSRMMDVDTLFVSDIIDNHRGKTKDGRKIYTLYDVYPHADLITYPSQHENLGRVLIESFYFKKPIIVNKYPAYQRDIEPKGFSTIEIDGYLTRNAVLLAKKVLRDFDFREEMVSHNFKLAQNHFSYSVLEKGLGKIIDFLTPCETV